MSEVYEKYFGKEQVSYGKARMMRDIKEHQLTGRELSALIDDLEQRDMLTNKHFIPKPKECWNEEYLNWLSNGHISDYFSRDYLEHFGEVADYVSRRRTSQKGRLSPGVVIGVVLAVVVLLLVYRYFSSRGERETPKRETTQGIQMEALPASTQSAVMRAAQMEVQRQDDLLQNDLVEGVQDIILSGSQSEHVFDTPSQRV